MPLDSGTKTKSAVTYEGSMAAAMEQAFREEWPYVMGVDADPPPSSEQLNLMFRAIAQGVIRHLQQNSASMKVEVTVNVNGTNYPGIGTVNKIEVKKNQLS
jgi:hypothetical protein